MTWREKLVVRILLVVARVVAGSDAELAADLRSLSTHIAVGVPSAEDDLRRALEDS